METQKLKGQVIFIGTELSVSDKFVKRNFVIKTKDEYPQVVIFQLSQSKVSIPEEVGMKQMDDVEVFYNIRGREWADPKTGEVKYFNTLDVWKVEMIKSQDIENFHAERGSDLSGDLPF